MSADLRGASSQRAHGRLCAHGRDGCRGYLIELGDSRGPRRVGHVRGAPSRPDQRASPQAGGYGPRGTLSEAPFSARRVAPEQKNTLCDVRRGPATRGGSRTCEESSTNERIMCLLFRRGVSRRRDSRLSMSSASADWRGSCGRARSYEAPSSGLSPPGAERMAAMSSSNRGDARRGWLVPRPGPRRTEVGACIRRC